MKILFIIIDLLILLLLCTIIVNSIRFIKKRRLEKENQDFSEDFEVFHDPNFKDNQKTKNHFSSQGQNFKQQINEKEQWDKLQTKYNNNTNTNDIIQNDLGIEINKSFEQGGLNMNNNSTNYFNL